MMRTTALDYLGVSQDHASHFEKLISAIGAFLGILVAILVTTWFTGADSLVYIIPSMGATAVLLFAVPHGALAQPWNVFGGHLISALIGVACAQWIPQITLAAAAAVGVSVAAMYYLRCIHPPGGATALAAVIGGESIQQLGYHYLLTPVLINVVAILVVAVLFNALFQWRRYPAALMQQKQETAQTPLDYAPVDHADLVYALSQIDSFIDVTEDDLLKIYQLATGRDVGTDSNNP
jgi:CBS domain-containing membrane protein